VGCSPEKIAPFLFRTGVVSGVVFFYSALGLSRWDTFRESHPIPVVGDRTQEAMVGGLFFLGSREGTAYEMVRVS
jgi:hypothetical protein